MEEIGKSILLLGVVLIIVGALFTFFPNLPSWPKLPGDIYIRKENFVFYFPLATSIVVSIILTIVIHFLRK